MQRSPKGQPVQDSKAGHPVVPRRRQGAQTPHSHGSQWGRVCGTGSRVDEWRWQRARVTGAQDSPAGHVHHIPCCLSSLSPTWKGVLRAKGQVRAAQWIQGFDLLDRVNTALSFTVGSTGGGPCGTCAEVGRQNTERDVGYSSCEFNQICYSCLSQLPAERTNGVLH